MLGLYECLLFILLVLTVSYVELTRWIWIPLFIGFFSLLTHYGHWPGFIWWLIWPLMSAVTLFGVWGRLRQEIIIKPVYDYLRRAMPKMGDTEREALEAGNTWWEAELFSGRPQFENLQSVPAARLTEEEQDFMESQVNTLCAMLDDWQIMNKHDLPKDVWDYMKSEKFFGLIEKKEYGGLGFSAYAHSCIVAKIATRSNVAAVTVMVPNSLGPGELLTLYGTDKQKNHYLPRLADGREIPCFALTGLASGSDAAAMTDTGVVCRGTFAGKEVLGLRLNFDKRYITLAPIATLLGLAVKVRDPSRLLGDEEDRGITLCLIPTKYEGIEKGRRHFPMNLPFMNGPISGKDVFVPMDWVIGGEAMIGQGWRMLMECLSVGRGISLPSLATAASNLSYRCTGAYARLREQFHLPIGKFEGVAARLANIAGNHYLIEATRCVTMAGLDNGAQSGVVSAIAKYHMTELARDSVNQAMDIHGGKAIQLGPKNYLASAYQGLPISITVEGANILTRNLIIFGQGAIRCHPYLQHEMEASQEEWNAATKRELDTLLLKHVGHFIRNWVRAFVCAITGSRFVKVPKTGITAQYYRQLSRMSSALASASDMAFLVLGGELKRRERLSARLGDVLSYLYMGSAALKYYDDFGKEKEDVAHMKWAAETCLHRAQEAFYLLLENFPTKRSPLIKFMVWKLRYTIFPFGRSYKKPHDSLESVLAKASLHASEFRERLGACFYVGGENSGEVALLERTLKAMDEAAPIYKKLREAIRLGLVSKKDSFEDMLRIAVKMSALTQAEAKRLAKIEADRTTILRVDSFEMGRGHAMKLDIK